MVKPVIKLQRTACMGLLVLTELRLCRRRIIISSSEQVLWRVLKMILIHTIKIMPMITSAPRVILFIQPTVEHIMMILLG